MLTTRNRRAAHGKHVCVLCLRRIAKDEVYEDQRCADYGTAYTVRSHLACVAAYSSWKPDWEECLLLSELSDGHLPPCPFAWSAVEQGAICTCSRKPVRGGVI